MKVRFVYVVARPLKAAGPLSFAWEGIFPICHWGILVSSLSGSVLERKIIKSNGRRGFYGTYFELYRNPAPTCPLFDNFDLVGFDSKWGYVSLVLVGETSASDARLKKEGNYDPTA